MKKNKLSHKKSARDRLIRNLLSSLVLYGEISTAAAKAKVLKSQAQKLIHLKDEQEGFNRKRLLEKILYGGATEMFESKKYSSVSIFILDQRFGDGAQKMLVRLNELKSPTKAEGVSKVKTNTSKITKKK